MMEISLAEMAHEALRQVLNGYGRGIYRGVRIVQSEGTWYQAIDPWSPAEAEILTLHVSPLDQAECRTESDADRLIGRLLMQLKTAYDDESRLWRERMIA